MLAPKLPTLGLDDHSPSLRPINRSTGRHIRKGRHDDLPGAEDNGVGVLGSYHEGICRTRETVILDVDDEGDHRVPLLNAEERAVNETMKICVSRGMSGSVTLDLQTGRAPHDPERRRSPGLLVRPRRLQRGRSRPAPGPRRRAPRHGLDLRSSG